MKEIFIEDIEFCGYEEAQCITIEDPRGLYVLENGIITHNSTFTMLALLYVACHVALMRDPWQFLSMARSSVLVFVLCAVTQSKASEIYSEPLRQIIESSTYWKYCRTMRDMTLEDKHLMESDTVEYLPYTFSAESSVMKTGNNLNWKQISSAGSLLGMNILMGAMTEITFFLEAGKGWALDLQTPILMKNKSIKLMKDIKIGDKLAHPENKENIVEKIPFEEEDDLYEVTLDNGKTAQCNLNHIWKVSFRKYSNGEKCWELVTTKFMIDHPKLKFEIPELY